MYVPFEVDTSVLASMWPAARACTAINALAVTNPAKEQIRRNDVHVEVVLDGLAECARRLRFMVFNFVTPRFPE